MVEKVRGVAADAVVAGVLGAAVVVVVAVAAVVVAARKRLTSLRETPSGLLLCP